MYILGIETSCDETAAAVVKHGARTLSNVVASSVELHKKSGGVIPEIAAREQLRCIIPVIDKALNSARSKWRIAGGKKTTCHKLRATSQVDAIAVTIGPGLISSLLVGVETAKTLAYVWQKPIVPVNHLLAHFYADWLGSRKNGLPQFPLIGLIASGGHTELILMRGHGNYQWLGGTRDDAAGECFDKCARILGLDYPGGPAIERTASNLTIHNSQFTIRLPRPMINQGNFDFSFSGLKTAVLKEVKKVSDVSKVSKDLAREIQEAVTDVLVKKTIRAAKRYKVKSIIVAGGVAANKRLKEKFRSIINHQLPATNLFIPPPQLCTDNATFIASYAFHNFKPVPWQKIQADASLSL
jgi:N6-L-threonylcarbamoyladenine synthase